MSENYLFLFIDVFIWRRVNVKRIQLNRFWIIMAKVSIFLNFIQYIFHSMLIWHFFYSYWNWPMFTDWSSYAFNNRYNNAHILCYFIHNLWWYEYTKYHFWINCGYLYSMKCCRYCQYLPFIVTILGSSSLSSTLITFTGFEWWCAQFFTFSSHL